MAVETRGDRHGCASTVYAASRAQAAGLEQVQLGTYEDTHRLIKAAHDSKPLFVGVPVE